MLPTNPARASGASEDRPPRADVLCTGGRQFL